MTYNNTVIPIFIIVHNHYEILKKSVASYENFIKTPIEIIFHNVCSTYYETINYLQEKEKEGYKVYESKQNNHLSVLNSIKDYISKHPECEYVVMTDPDIELYNVNGDILEFYIHLIQETRATSAGPMLKIDDIPDEYHNKEQAIRGQKSQFWNLKKHNMSFKGENYKFVSCGTDTTFQLFSVNNIPKRFPHPSIRTLEPYSARHLDWYVCYDNIAPCELFYQNNTTNISHWNNKNWRGKYYSQTINIINDFFPNKYKYVYYYNRCKCRNNYNFGDFITPYIYKKLFLKDPILNISGGKDEDVVIGAGSVLCMSNGKSVIWGTGFMHGDEKIGKPKEILSVRGPLTRSRLIKTGIECPERYGDIGLILPYFYYPKQPQKIYRLGIIPHYIDKNKFNEIYKKKDRDVLIIDVTENIEKVINSILLCQMTISSSLHGIIVSHAYNVRSMWIKITNSIGGGNFKYRDYYGSLNIENYGNMVPYLYKEQISTDETIKLINEYPNPTFPINTKPILELCPFINIKKTI